MTAARGVTWRPYTQMKTAAPPLEVVSASGVRLTLRGGRSLIDGIASWWTACHGYRHPHIEGAVKAQLERLPHVMFGGLTHAPAERLADQLAAVLPGDLGHVFLAESGSVSVEVAMKMAIQTQAARGQPHRSRFLSFHGGYHGDTFATMSVCDPEEGMHRRFARALVPQVVLPLPDTPDRLANVQSVLRQHPSEIAAVLIEPLVQGAGGMRFHDPEVLRSLRSLCDETDTLLIFDEIMTGFGRTGSMFACEQADVVPDIITLSKALTGGTLPLSAAVATKEVFMAFWSDDPEAALMHGPTYMANPLGCAAAVASLELFEREPRLEQARSLEVQLFEALRPCAKLPGVVDVRARGAIGVVQVEDASGLHWMRRRFADEGVWIRPLGDVVYLAPPLIIEPEDLETLAAAIFRVVQQWGAGR